MAKKFNMTVVKDTFFKHGEKIALGTCVFVALLLGALAFLRAMGAGYDPKTGKAWAKAYEEETNRLNSMMASRQPTPLDKEKEALLDPEPYAWKKVDTVHQQLPLINTGEDQFGNKRAAPVAYTPKRDPKLIQLDYIRALVFTHDYDENTQKGAVVYKLEGGAGGSIPMGVEIFPKGQSNPQPGAPGAAGPRPEYSRKGRPMRMVKGTLVFPLKEQMEAFRKALRYSSQREMLDQNPDDLPKFLGFNLVRFEIFPDGSAGKPETLINHSYDPKGKSIWKLADSIKRMLKETVFDEETPTAYEPYVYAGLTMPLPQLANATYPKFEVPGIEPILMDEKGKKGEMVNPKMPPITKKEGPGVIIPGKKPPRPEKPPMMETDPGKGEMPDMTRKPILLKDLKTIDAPLAARLFSKDLEEKVNVYHALGEFPEKAPAVQPKDKYPPTMLPPGQGKVGASGRFFSAYQLQNDPNKVGPEGYPMPVVPMPMPMPVEQPMGKEGEQPTVPAFEWDRDAVVYFIDPEVEPGKVYQYALQVRIANPNHGKEKLVAFASLAKDRELQKGDTWVYTHAIKIPDEYQLYAVDQQILDDWAADKVDKKGPPNLKDRTTFQIHQWVKTTRDETDDYVIGDWAIAERLLVARGDHIGYQAPVQVPVWRLLKNSFEMPHTIKDKKDKKKDKPGIIIKLSRSTDDKQSDPPVLVDFVGGRKFKSSGAFEEEAAVDALVVESDGSLRVLNSRIDSDPANASAKERQQRVTNARRRADEFIGRPAADTKKGGVPVPGADRGP